MKMMLKVLALPVLFVVKSICILGNLLTNISSYVIGLLLLVIAGCAIYCIVQAMWTSLAILVGMGLAAILAIFLLVWAVVKFETLGNHISVRNGKPLTPMPKQRKESCRSNMSRSRGLSFPLLPRP